MTLEFKVQIDTHVEDVNEHAVRIAIYRAIQHAIDKGEDALNHDDIGQVSVLLT